MIEIEDFLEDYSSLEALKSVEFKDETNDVDGVVYPLILKDVPQPVINDVVFNLTHKVLGRAPINPLIFLRKSPKGVPVPHKFHTDHSMGDYSMMIYMDDEDGAGTGMAVHNNTGLTRAPYSQADLDETINDCNNPEKWTVYKRFQMKPNKAAIFDSDRFHVALPIGGYGQGKDSRVVLTCFFS